jgi:hypothetical protein
MDLKDLASIIGIIIAGIVAIIGYLKYRLDKLVARQAGLPKVAKPFVRMIHTTTSSSLYATTYLNTIEIANRNDRNIVIKTIHWWLESIRTRWPIIPNRQSPQTLSDLPYKLETSELFQVTSDANYQNSADILGPILTLKGLDRSIAICNLSIEVTLTTGECIIQRVPCALRESLVDWHSHPTFLHPILKWYINRRP